MRKYDSYKDSGIEWIGEIPSHWTLNKVKHNFSFKTGFTPPSGKTEYYENGTHVWINISDLQEKEVHDSVNKLTDKALEDYKPEIVPKGSLLYSFKLSVGRVGFNTIDCYTNEAIFSIDPNGSANLNFFYYSLPEQIIKNANENIYGAKILNQELIKNAFLVAPTPEEQTAIAAYLDRKTAEIDELIADKKRLLELYEEEKTAIINELVTGKKVWDGYAWTEPAEVKDSGIEWLGEIPEHWEVKRLSWCFEIIGSGTTPKAGSEEYYLNGEFNWLLTGDLTDGDILETSKKVTQKALDDHSSLKKYPVNSIVMAMYGATIGKLGILKIPTTVNQACCVMGSPIHLHYQFAFFLLLAARKEIINMSYGGGQPNISQELIKSFRVQVPPFEEQQSIVHHIETESAQIDAKRAKTEKLIELLTEYRTALISEVVTGKIKVIE